MTRASARKRAEALALLRARRVGSAALARRAGRPGRGHGGAARGGARAPAGPDSRPAARKVPQGRRPGCVRGGRAVRDRAGQLPGGRARGRKPALREHPDAGCGGGPLPRLALGRAAGGAARGGARAPAGPDSLPAARKVPQGATSWLHARRPRWPPWPARSPRGWPTACCSRRSGAGRATPGARFSRTGSAICLGSKKTNGTRRRGACCDSCCARYGPRSG